MSFSTQLPDGSSLTIDGTVLTVMWSLVQRRCWDSEAGGLLIGQYLPSTSTYVLDRVTRPLPGDIRSRFGFLRRQRKHQAVLDQEWRDSDQTRTYFGEWHTHPERVPIPSPVDLRSWNGKLLNPSMVVPRLYFIIVGQVKTGVWFGNCGTDAIKELAMFETGVKHGN